MNFGHKVSETFKRAKQCKTLSSCKALSFFSELVETEIEIRNGSFVLLPRRCISKTMRET